jgi:serine/threonine-protein kinase HipA
VNAETLFEQLALSIVVGNGDAHLKNFAVLYGSPEHDPRLSPLYDVICTAPYGDTKLALTLKGSRAFPDRATLERFGREHRIHDPAAIIDRIVHAAAQVLATPEARAHPEIADGIDQARRRMAARRALRQRRQDA